MDIYAPSTIKAYFEVLKKFDKKFYMFVKFREKMISFMKMYVWKNDIFYEDLIKQLCYA
jgi:hypothetical protein